MGPWMSTLSAFQPFIPVHTRSQIWRTLWEGVSCTRICLGSAFEIDTFGKEGWRRKPNWLEGQIQLSLTPAEAWEWGGPSEPLQVESRGQDVIPLQRIVCECHWKEARPGRVGFFSKEYPWKRLTIEAVGRQHSQKSWGNEPFTPRWPLQSYRISDSPRVLFPGHTGPLPAAPGPSCLLFLSLKPLAHCFPLLCLFNSCSFLRSYLIDRSTGKLLQSKLVVMQTQSTLYFFSILGPSHFQLFVYSLSEDLVRGMVVAYPSYYVPKGWRCAVSNRHSTSRCRLTKMGRVFKVLNYFLLTKYPVSHRKQRKQYADSVVTFHTCFIRHSIRCSMLFFPCTSYSCEKSGTM